MHSQMLNRWLFTPRRSFEKRGFLPRINPNSIRQLGFRDSKDLTVINVFFPKTGLQTMMSSRMRLESGSH